MSDRREGLRKLARLGQRMEDDMSKFQVGDIALLRPLGMIGTVVDVSTGPAMEVIKVSYREGAEGVWRKSRDFDLLERPDQSVPDTRDVHLLLRYVENDPQVEESDAELAEEVAKVLRTAWTAITHLTVEVVDDGGHDDA